MAVTFAFAGATVWACGGGEETSKEPSCPRDDPSTPDTDESLCRAIAAIESGREAVEIKGCKKCHGEDMSGATAPLTGKDSYTKSISGEEVKLFPPNLTPDPTGIGVYDDDKLALAIRTGVDENSQFLCPQMKHFSEMSDFEVYSIVLYLRSLPPVSKQIPRSVCPPTKPAE